MSIISDLRDKIVRYVSVYLKMARLSIIEHTSNIAGYFIFTIIVLLCAFCALLFAGFGLAEFFTDLIGSRTAGFFMAMGAYVLLLIVLFLFRNGIRKAFAGTLVRVLTEAGDDEEKENK